MLNIYYEEVELKKNLIVLQEGNKDCGAACLLSIVRYYGGDVSLERLLNLTKTDKEGTNFYNLSEASSNIGLNTKCYKVDSNTKLQSISTPFIVQINNKNYMHFIVVYKIYETKVLIMDPSIGKKIIDLFDFTNIWTGNIMLFEKIKTLPIYREDKPLNRVIISTILKNKSIIIFLIVLSFIFTFYYAKDQCQFGFHFFFSPLLSGFNPCFCRDYNKLISLRKRFCLSLPFACLSLQND